MHSVLAAPRGRTLSLLALGAATALALTACAAPAAAPAAQDGGTLVYATGDAEPTCLDPHVGGNYPQALVATQYLESLVSKNADGDVIPWLAESWEETGTSITYTLKDGITCADGTEFTAETAAANFAYQADAATGTFWFGSNVTADMTATTTVTTRTVSPNITRGLARTARNAPSSTSPSPRGRSGTIPGCSAAGGSGGAP